MGIFFAILSATGWGISAVLIGAGLRNVKVVPGTALSILSSFFTIGLITALLQWEELFSITWQGILWFVLIGIMSFSLGRLFSYMGIKRIGATKTTSITASAPIFACLTAVIFLKEVPNLLIVMGIILVVGGLYLTMSSK